MEDVSNPPIDKRHLSRLLAVQYLFTRFFAEKNNVDYQAFEPQALLQIIDENKFNTKLYQELIDGVEKHKEAIDKIIEEVAPAWPLDQINPINLIILRLAIWEGFVGKINPPKVVINEAIELDKELSSKTNSSFINGVLGNIFSNAELQERLSNFDKKNE